MQKPPIPTVLRHLRRLMGRTATASVTDGELLTRFVVRQDEAAFSALMERHGGMVLAVCRRLLDHHDAEDVFQATFLLLVRKALAIRKYESVGSWLHGVAYRLAMKARVQGTQRRQHERDAADRRDTADFFSEIAWRELQQVLDEELQRLPDRYRLVLIHCCLEEQTHEEAASALGLPVGTVKSRLVRGKERLRRRMARRGLTLSATAFATFLAVAGGAPAGLPPLLSQTTTQAAVLVASGRAVAGVVSAKVLPLVEGGMSAMTASNMKPAVLVLLLAALLAGGGALGWGVAGHQGDELRPAVETKAAQPDEPAPRLKETRAQDVDPPMAFPPSEALTANLNWHQETRADEIRMSWFLRGNPGIALLCRIDLAKGKVHLEREVFQRARQSTRSHEPTRAQLNTMRDLVKSLPTSQKNLDLNNVVLVSVAPKDKAQTCFYNRLDLPGAIRRLYDLSGASLDTELAEAAPYSDPLAYKRPNTHLDVGEDVPPLPQAAGLGRYRYVDPDGRLLGLDYFVGNWDKRTTLWRLAPVFNAEQPKQHAARSIARKGYAVAGAEVNADKYVCGIRLLFRRVKADGTFDANDAYAGQWIGAPPAGGAATRLVDDGRRVIGIAVHMGAIVDRFALVADPDARK